MSGQFGWKKLDKPRGFYRSGLTVEQIRLAMKGLGWLSTTQIVGAVGDYILPEGSFRYAQLRGGTRRRCSGERHIVKTKLNDLVARGKVEKHGIGKEVKFRWIESQNDSAKKDTPGRGHAIKDGVRRGSNQAVRRTAKKRP